MSHRWLLEVSFAEIVKTDLFTYGVPWWVQGTPISEPPFWVAPTRAPLPAVSHALCTVNFSRGVPWPLGDSAVPLCLLWFWVANLPQLGDCIVCAWN